MRFFVVAAAIASIASAANITVKVGENSGLTFDPTSVTAAEGDIVQFQFLAKNHTVTQSTFADPCQKMTTPSEGVDSGFVPVSNASTEVPMWSFTVNNASAPLWFYCAQTGHCAKGMVFAINPTANKSFAAFQAAAMASTTNTTSSSSASGSAASGTSSSTRSAASGAASNTAATSASAGAASGSSAANGATSISYNTVLLMVAFAVGGMLL
ncbi:Cupredoxin [Desarmillaria tabescens]|uniref:Cupredoxin n=1 Tax=Armillaria tabescens TaxID=1929756 RepID=A0AA39NEY3_ARMTA|nr:Cupredoxin [Desarmillaria tabescens]KAK0464376.1 Cupredoxin [Desarmillaria tabescens]